MKLLDLRGILRRILDVSRGWRAKHISSYQQIARRLQEVREKGPLRSGILIHTLFKNIAIYRKELHRYSVCLIDGIEIRVPENDVIVITVAQWFVDHEGYYISDRELEMFLEEAIRFLTVYNDAEATGQLSQKTIFHMKRVVENLDCLSKELI